MNLKCTQFLRHTSFSIIEGYAKKFIYIFRSLAQVLNDGVGNYGQLWITIDKIKYYVLVSQNYSVIVI